MQRQLPPVAGNLPERIDLAGMFFWARFVEDIIEAIPDIERFFNVFFRGPYRHEKTPMMHVWTRAYLWYRLSRLQWIRN